MIRPAAMISRDGDCLRVTGAITLANARVVLEEGIAALGVGDLRIDLAQVKDVDSSAVGLLLEWMRAARRENRRLTFVNLPQNLHSLASLYDVLDLLPRGEDS